MDSIEVDWEAALQNMGQFERDDARQRLVPSTASAPRPAPVQVRAGELGARTVKVSIVVAAGDVLALRATAGQSHVATVIKTPELSLRTTFNAKSVRRAQQLVQEAESNGIVVLCQGKLGAGNTIEEAGLSVQPRGPRP